MLIFPFGFKNHYVPFVHFRYGDYRPLFRASHMMNTNPPQSADYGVNPLVVNINKATKANNMYRTTIWTGSNLQVTLMSIPIGETIGLEMHPHIEQILRIEQGQGVVEIGNAKDNLKFVHPVSDDSMIIVPAGCWHNLKNTGNIPLKLYSIYAPPNHPFGTVHTTKSDAMNSER